MSRAARPLAGQDQETVSASRHSPAPTTSSDTSTLPLPAPSPSRNLRPRVHIAHSRTASRRDSLSVGNSRVASTTNSREGSELSDFSGDSDSISTRKRKRRKIGTDGAEGATTASGNSYLDTTPRPDWRNSSDYEEDVDQLDGSDGEETRGPVPSEGSTVQHDTAASTRWQSATPPPPTAVSPIRETSGVSHFAVLSSPPTSWPGPSNSGSRAKSSLPSGLGETPASPVSSPSLMKIINETNIEPGLVPSKRKRASPSSEPEIIEVSPIISKDKGKGKAKVSPSSTPPILVELKSPEAEPLSEYTCPICFFPPSNATLTPCGHVCCGTCLFTAVKTTLQRGASMGMMVGAGENVARCPVCRAVIPGWDGKGGGVIGIKVRQVISL